MRRWREFWRGHKVATVPVPNETARIVHLVSAGAGAAPKDHRYLHLKLNIIGLDLRWEVNKDGPTAGAAAVIWTVSVSSVTVQIVCVQYWALYSVLLAACNKQVYTEESLAVNHGRHRCDNTGCAVRSKRPGGNGSQRYVSRG
jgi:hypothetical protein